MKYLFSFVPRFVRFCFVASHQRRVSVTPVSSNLLFIRWNTRCYSTCNDGHSTTTTRIGRPLISGKICPEIEPPEFRLGFPNNYNNKMGANERRGSCPDVFKQLSHAAAEKAAAVLDWKSVWFKMKKKNLQVFGESSVSNSIGNLWRVPCLRALPVNIPRHKTPPAERW